jgi:hypothetical protein
MIQDSLNDMRVYFSKEVETATDNIKATHFAVRNLTNKVKD